MKTLTPAHILSGLCIMLGLTVMGGWLLEQDRIVQILPSLVPMQFNTALGFVLAGVATQLLINGRPTLGLIPTYLLLLLATSTLAEYVFGIDLGIDQLFHDHHLDVHSPARGRMAANTALTYWLTSVALLTGCHFPGTRFGQNGLGMLGGAVVGFGVVALFGYITNLVPTYGWGNMSRMAVHTALGFCCIGSAMLCYSYTNINSRADTIAWLGRKSVPLVITVMSCLFLALQVESDKQLSAVLKAESEVISSQMAADLEKLNFAHKHLSQLASLPRAKPAATGEWLVQESLMAEIVRLNAEFVPLAATGSTFADRHFLTDHQNLLRQHLQRQVNTTGHPADDQAHFDLLQVPGEPPALLLVTRLDKRSTANGEMSPDWLIALIDYPPLVNQYQRHIAQLGLALTQVSLNGQILVQTAPREDIAERFQPHTSEFIVDGQTWAITSVATDTFTNLHRSPVTAIVRASLMVVIALLVLVSALLLSIQFQKRVAERLSDRNQKVMLAMLDGLIVITPDGIILEANHTAESIFGYSRSDMLGQNVNMLMPKSFADAHNGYLARNTPQEHSNIIGKQRTLTGKRADGSEFPLELSVTSSQTDSGLVYTGIVHDLSELHNSKAKLNQVENLFKTATSSSAAGFAILNLSGHILEANQALARWLNISSASMLEGKTLLSFCSDKSHEALSQELAKLRLDQAQAITLEIEFTTQKQNTVWGAIAASQVNNQQGKPQFIVVQIIDITEQKNLSRDLAAQNTELASLNVELNQFAHIASHDLKEPLRTLRTFSNYLLKDLAANKQDRVAQDVHHIEDAALRMTNLIDGLLKLTIAGNEPIERVPVNLDQVFQEVASNLNSLIHETQTQLVIEGDAVTLEGNQSLLVQVVQNLVNNAIKFMPKDRTPEIRIATHLEHDQAHISLCDNGIGIAQEHQEQIFLAFKRLHSSGAYPGTGIGLAIVKKVIDRHEGNITLESTVGQGTCFHLRLPIMLATEI